MDSIDATYAKLLVNYCLGIQAGEKLFVSSTVLAEPLVREVYRCALAKGAHVMTDLKWRGQNRIFFSHANEDQLAWVNPLVGHVYGDFDAYLYIRAPYNLREDQQVDAEKQKKRGQAMKPLHETYNVRTADRSLKRCLCQYPTQASAQEAGMSLEEYQHFVFEACRLYEEDPQASWLAVREEQQSLVDYLNQAEEIHYLGEGIDLTFNVKGRTWINSDGQTNMPSGEVYSAPIEDSANGVIYFSYPSVFRGHPVEGITLWMERGEVVKWEAKQGKELLDQIFRIDGAKRLGEVAIGTNYHIQQATKNILFDEKIGGTVHLAVGQSYIQTGGKNNSTVHWDMIAEMKNGGQIIADGERIYENGRFLI